MAEEMNPLDEYLAEYGLTRKDFTEKELEELDVGYDIEDDIQLLHEIKAEAGIFMDQFDLIKNRVKKYVRLTGEIADIPDVGRIKISRGYSQDRIIPAKKKEFYEWAFSHEKAKEFVEEHRVSPGIRVQID